MVKEYIDYRGVRIIDVFSVVGGKGQVNISYENGSKPAGWHKHPWVDVLYCVKGKFKVGVVGLGKKNIVWYYMKEREPSYFIIWKDEWHGFKAMEPDSILLYYMSEKYDGDKIEELPIGHFGENWND